MIPLPDAGISGLKSFDGMVLRDRRGESVLMSNDIIRMYRAHVQRSQLNGREPLQFADWIEKDVRAPHNDEVSDDSAAVG